MTASDAAQNIVLTGFMGTGKTTTGKRIAKMLGRPFVDTDKVIAAEHGPIPEIFATQGEAAFRALERQVAQELSQQSGLVISTGGGLLVDPVNAEVLGATGRIFCLTASAAAIISRVTGPRRAKRPLLDVEDPEAKVTELLAERSEAYEAFEQVNTDYRSTHHVALDIISRL